MRFTVILDDDVAAGIRNEMERSGETFKQVVNRLMRLGFGVPDTPTQEHRKARLVNRRDGEI